MSPRLSLSVTGLGSTVCTLVTRSTCLDTVPHVQHEVVSVRPVCSQVTRKRGDGLGERYLRGGIRGVSVTRDTTLTSPQSDAINDRHLFPIPQSPPPLVASKCALRNNIGQTATHRLRHLRHHAGGAASHGVACSKPGSRPTSDGPGRLVSSLARAMGRGGRWVVVGGGGAVIETGARSPSCMTSRM